MTACNLDRLALREAVLKNFREFLLVDPGATLEDLLKPGYFNAARSRGLRDLDTIECMVDIGEDMIPLFISLVVTHGGADKLQDIEVALASAPHRAQRWDIALAKSKKAA